MPTSMTFDSLLVDLRAYLERGTSVDPTVFAQLPRLINLAERDLATALKIQGFTEIVVGSMAVGTSVYPKPDRWRDTVSMNFGIGVNQVRTPLFPRSYEYCRAYWPDEDLTDEPEFYADYGYFNWLISPTPNFAYPFEITYYQLPPLLDSTNQTNWTTDYIPNAILHGSLLQCAPFVKDDQRIPVWQSAYDRDLSMISGQDIEKIIDRSTSRQEA